MRQDMRLERRRVPPRQIQAAHRARNVWSARRNQDIPHSVDSSRTSAPLTVVHAILSEYSAPRCGKHLPNPPNNACRPTLLAQPLTWARLFQLVLMPPACALMTVASSAADADVGRSSTASVCGHPSPERGDQPSRLRAEIWYITPCMVHFLGHAYPWK